MLIKKILFQCLILLLISACGSVPKNHPKPKKVEEISKKEKKGNQYLIQSKTNDEVRKAYENYLNSAEIDENSRFDALSRLAEIEFNSSNDILAKNENSQGAENFEDRLYNAKLDNTIHLLSTSLKDYPNLKSNDAILYNLAKAHDLRGNHQQSVELLIKLVEKYENSPNYIEARFRVAENAFSARDYAAAEFSYSEVINAEDNQIFYEKSLFKRGWSRFKQAFYIDAVDDFLEAIVEHDFKPFEKLDQSEREQFDEYFRPIGLAFSNLGGVIPLVDYFEDRPDFKYTYHSYSMVADTFLKQERYSDAVQIHKQFIKGYPKSTNVPYSDLKIIEIWKNSGFLKKVYKEIDHFYLTYNPSSRYWKDQNKNSRVNRAIRRSLKEYVVLMSGYYHNQYQTLKSKRSYTLAENWYQRYLKHFDAYAQNDDVFFLYGELLSQEKNYLKALKYYRLAAYDEDLIIHKKAAYAALLMTDKLINSTKNNKKLVNTYVIDALRYAQAYPQDPKTFQITKHGLELAFNAGSYKSSIELADLIANNKNTYVMSIKSESYFRLNEYAEAESLYTTLLKTHRLSKKQKYEFTNSLALSIYKQGEAAQKQGNTAESIRHYSRISNVAKSSKIASTGLYDAIALYMQEKQWSSAINNIKRFQRFYPGDKLQDDVVKKLSIAYLNSKQNVKAAAEFEKISSSSSDLSIKTAALWQAAELYEEKNKLNDAIRSYREYAKKFKKPYAQNMEAMVKLSELYTKTKAINKANFWFKNIIKADDKALNNVKTERTLFIASQANLKLARQAKRSFDLIKLTLPLTRSLKKKKAVMLSAKKYYGNASKYNIFQATTEATFSIALIYKDFSMALITSDRPKNLSEGELDQYEILLEDKAFPFEDKSIEFFEINLARIKDGHYNEWIQKSRSELKVLFPVRYNREPKIDSFIILGQ